MKTAYHEELRKLMFEPDNIPTLTVGFLDINAWSCCNGDFGPFKFPYFVVHKEG